ncbi:hypothetical protein DPMN_060397 [Dreissena polymorpha]|uniref:EF-hand domain-containing protein n=1 Tax=Dreissena polymorpha TaxID=45954 RepID=A0A9D4HHG4_DREPO|nr:hypothetical protein DPMN_060397 [Dreissena polymorpha]
MQDVSVDEDFMAVLERLAAKSHLNVKHGKFTRKVPVKEFRPPKPPPRDPITMIYDYKYERGYRTLDLLMQLDKDNNFIIDRQEFTDGLAVSGELDWLSCYLLAISGELDWLSCDLLAVNEYLDWLSCYLLAVSGELDWLSCYFLAVSGELDWLSYCLLAVSGELDWLSCYLLAVSGELDWLSCDLLTASL